MQSSLFRTNQTENKYRITRANMSRVKNEEVMVHCKTVTDNLLTVLGLLVEHSTAITKTKVYLEVPLSIRQPSIKVTSSIPVIYPSLSSSLFFSSMLRSNIRSHWSFNVVNSADLCGSIIMNVKTKWTASRNLLSFINLIKGKYVLLWGPSISLNTIVEEIKSAMKMADRKSVL